MKHVLFLAALFCICINIKAQSLILSAGTDFPYQHYAGATIVTKNIDFSVRTGILIPPYSDIILSFLEEVGTNKSYTRMLESAYQFGWMNSASILYKFGHGKQWYCGPEIRLDYFAAADTPSDVIEAAAGTKLFFYDFFNPIEFNTKLGLTTYATGLRIGRKITIGKNDRNHLNLEFSVAKHFMTQSRLLVNNNKSEDINTIIDNMLWKNVFRNHGYIGGIGISYSFSLK